MRAQKLSRLSAPSFRLSLHIRHPSMDPADISRELLCDADESFKAGEPRKSRSGLPVASVYAETYWAATLEPTFWGTIGKRGKHEAAIDDVLAPDQNPDAQSADLERVAYVAGRMSDLPEDRHSRLKQLIARGHAQGYLTHAQIKEHLPSEITEPVQIEDVVNTLSDMGIPVHKTAPIDVPVQAQLAAVMRSMGGVIALICARLSVRHESFLSRVRTEGGGVRLVVTLSPNAVRGFSLAPETALRLGQLGIEIEFEFAADS